MTARQLSVPLDQAIAAAAVDAAARSGMTLSAWLNQAAANELAVEAGRAAMSEWEAEHGELTSEELDAAAERLPR